jgi:DNA-binding CsgD family transcriptional regulator
MKNKLRNSGFLFAGIFLAGFLINFFGIMFHGKGLIAALTHPYQLILAACCLVFLASGLVAKLRWLQPVVFLAAAPLASVPDPQSIFGLGFFIMGALLLERAGFMQRRRILTLGLLTIYLVILEVAAVLYAKHSLLEAIGVTFFILAFALFLWYLYEDKLVIIIKEPKPRVSLAEKGLANAERLYTMALIKGRSPKEIAADFGVSISTVRTTLVRAYRKLEVEDAFELLALSITHEVVE